MRRDRLDLPQWAQWFAEHPQTPVGAFVSIVMRLCLLSAIVDTFFKTHGVARVCALIMADVLLALTGPVVAAVERWHQKDSR